GVGARNPRECLLLQLSNLPATPARELARTIVSDHLEQLAARDYARIKKATGCDDEALRLAQDLIRSLNPRPGAQFAALDTRYVVPDVIVKKVNGQWVAHLNQEAMPRLRINRQYAELLRRHRASGGSNLAGQLQEAKWLIKNVQQRFETIARVSQAIVDRQRAFFEHGEVAMRPLTLREIAETVDLHESTISRVTTQKYLACPRGVYELKYFFGSHVATETGGAASSTAIRALIRQLVAAEDGHKPLSDARIADILGEQGFKVARRTVAKYRESLGIPPVNLRKTL
ncbi:MAG: RNA polymerase factor sigma-54, partial [Rhodocyclaceae bacterium]